MFAFFWPKNKFRKFITPVLSRLSPPDYFLFAKLKMKLKWLHFSDFGEIQDAVADELKNAQNEKFWAASSNCTTAQKSVYMPMEFILNEMKKCVFRMCLRILKKSVLNLWTAVCIYYCA